MTRLWDILKREDKAKLRTFMPAGWRPRRREPRRTKLEGKLETIEELTKLMKQGPGFYRDETIL